MDANQTYSDRPIILPTIRFCIVATLVLSSYGFFLLADDKPVVIKDVRPEDKKAVRAKLARKVPKVDFAGIRFADALKFASDKFGPKIYVDWSAKKGQEFFTPKGFAKWPVYVHLTDATTEQVMRYILRSVSGVVRLEYVFEKDGIRILTNFQLHKRLVEKQYEVSDILKITDKANKHERLESLIWGVITWYPHFGDPNTPTYRWKSGKLTVAGHFYFHKELEALLEAVRHPIEPGGKGGKHQREYAEERRVLKKLDEQCKTSVNRMMTLNQAVHLLRRETGANVFVDWGNMRVWEVKPTDRVHLNTKGGKISKILEAILDTGKKDERILGFRLEGDVFVIGGESFFKHGLFTRAYDISKLVGKETTVLTDSSSKPEPGNERAVALRARILKVAPPVTYGKGFPPEGTVHIIGGRLVLHHNWRSHHKVAGFLENMRNQNQKKQKVTPPSRPKGSLRRTGG